MSFIGIKIVSCAYIEGEHLKQTKLLLLFFTSLLVFGLMNIDVENIIILQESTENVFLDRKMLPAYTSHEAIRIVNNTDFIWQAGNESWLGDGSEEYPYIIHGYNITDDTTDGIYIRDVSIYFEIRDCLITSTGIRYDMIQFSR